MSNILILSEISPNKFGSFEEQMILLSAELVHRRNVCFLGFISEPEPEMRARFEKVGAKILVLPYTPNGNIFAKIKNSFDYYKLIDKYNISLIGLNFYSITSPYLIGVFLSKAKVIFTDHSSRNGGFHRSRIRSFVSKIVLMALSKRVSLYIAVSDYVRTRLHGTHFIKNDKIIRIYNGVNLDRFKPRDLVSSRTKLGLPLDKTILCAVAHLIPAKGIQHLINALELLRKKNTSRLLLVIAGEGPYRTALEEQILNLNIADQVIFLGKRNDIHTVIAASDIIVIPSIWEEAFGLIIAEAMACAKPVIASSIGGIPELVENGNTGFLVTPGQEDELAEAVQRLLENPDLCNSLGKNAFHKATAEFGIASYINKMADIFGGQ
jgi:glycosyltransferase involved in cell wall biosynthesis